MFVRVLCERVLYLFWISLAFGSPFVGGVGAQAPNNPGFDPSDVYFQAYLATRNGETLEREKDYVGALKKYKQAGELFDSVAKFYPDWKSKMVKNRRDLTSGSIQDVKRKAAEQLEEARGVVAELEGGFKVGGEDVLGGAAAIEPEKNILKVDPMEARRLQDAEQEVDRLRGEIRRVRSNSEMRDSARVDDLRKLNNLLESKLKAAQSKMQIMRARMAAAPVASEMDALNREIENLEQERRAMGMALQESRQDHTKALSKVEILTADIEIMREQANELRQKEADTKRDLQSERRISNEVVAGQRRQIDELEKALEAKAGELEQANVRITQLMAELEQSREAFTELQGERNSLLQERDQMAALLKLNEAGRIEQLIEQNMGLARDLREANEKVERLNLNSNAVKDDVVDALRDLAIAKSQINRLHAEKREQDRRMKDLEERLEAEEASLVSGDSDASDEEVEILREVIRRTLRVQDRRRQAKELLVDAAKALGKDNPKLKAAIDLFDSSEIELTPDEQRLVADQQVDGEFFAPRTRDQASVESATDALNLELDSYDRAATKAFLAGRLLPTRELFEMMVERHPGHVPGLCKLGVVQIKLNEISAAGESFRKAIELDPGNAYAHQMLGYTYLRAENLPSAEEYVSKAIELSPSEAKGYLLLGTIKYRQGNLDEAEAKFKSAISVDPIPSEPYFNLGMLYAKNGKSEEAREFYAKALERGAVPDQGLEKRIQMP